MTEISTQFREDTDAAKKGLAALRRDWEGKASILELKEADYQWRQMEWWAFYFEYLCRVELKDNFQIPGEKFGTVTFDLKRNFNWDYKAKAIKSDDHKAILNDKTAINSSLEQYGEHGVIVALCDVEYNDTNRTFQQWHSELKGGLSAYEVERKTRTAVSRYRKTKAVLAEILFLRLDTDNLSRLGTMRQGRNSNGAPRPEKYMLDLEDIEAFQVDSIVFSSVP